MERKDQSESRPAARHGRILESVLGLFALAAFGSFVSFDRTGLTEALGFVALAAVGVIVLWILLTIVRDAKTRSHLRVAQSAAQSQIEFYASERIRLFKEEVARIEQECDALYAESVDSCRRHFPDLVANARLGLDRMARAYARFAKVGKDVDRGQLANRFKSVVGEQWAPMKADLGYSVYSEIEARLSEIKEYQSVSDSMRLTETSALQELSPSLERARSAAQLFGAIRIESMAGFRQEAMEGIEPFFSCYQRSVREWLNGMVFQVVIRLRDQGKQGASIDDTGAKARLVRLKNVFETVGRSLDRVGAGMEKVGDQKSACAQLMFAACVMSVVGALPEWFPELGTGEEEAQSAASAVALEA